MNILILHNSYQHAGGEDAVVDAEVALLARAGHEVRAIVVGNDSIVGVHAKVRAFINVAHDPARADWMDKLIDDSRPDLVHVHNFFPLLTPAIHIAASRRGVAVVQTLHNFRLLCASATFLRDGRICEKCLHGSKLSGIAHRCYRGSLAGSLAVVRMQFHAERHNTWSHVDRFIALTEFARSKFIEGGIPGQRIAVKPNFMYSELDTGAGKRRGALFAGRLSREKGVDVLLRAWADLPDIELTVAGDGPELERLKAAAPGNVRFLGRVTRDDILALMRSAEFLVLPSLWYEGFPMTIVEAFANGLPVVCSRLGSMAEIVGEGVNGALFAAGDADALRRVVRQYHPDGFGAMAAAARQTFEQLYSPESNVHALESIYADALEVRRQRSE